MRGAAGLRIAYLANFAPRKLGTGEDRLVALAAAAHERGHQLTVFGHDPVHPDVVAAFARSNTAWRSLNEISRRPLVAARHLAQHFDVIQLNAIAPRSRAALAAYAAWPAKVLFVDHVSAPPGERFSDRSWWRRVLDRLTFLRVMQVAGVSDYVRRRAQRRFGLPPRRTCVVYGGVDTNRFRPGSEAAPGGPLRVITVAALIPEKGIDVLIDAMAKLGDVDWRLQVVGDGPDRERVEGRAGDLGLAPRVTFVGLRDDVDALLRDSDVFVHPAVWQEALGYTILEAMASGLAVIASRVGGIPELIRGPEEGILVEAGDREALATHLRGLARDPDRRARLGVKARARVVECFTLERNVARTLEWFEAASRDELLPIHDSFRAKGTVAPPGAAP